MAIERSRITGTFDTTSKKGTVIVTLYMDDVEIGRYKIYRPDGERLEQATDISSSRMQNAIFDPIDAEGMM